MTKKPLKIIGGIFFGLVVLLLVVIAGFTAASAFDLPEGYRLLIVQSGSMEPTIQTGSLIVVSPQDSYRPGDIVTYSSGPGKTSTTHRIVAKQDSDFILKGDANDAPDSEAVSPDQIQGRLTFAIPYLGYPVSFAKTQNGLILLVVIPAVLIIYSEILSIKTQIKKLKLKRRLKV